MITSLSTHVYEIAKTAKLGIYFPSQKWKETFFKERVMPYILETLGSDYLLGDSYAKTALYDHGKCGNIYRIKSAKGDYELPKVLKLYKICPKNQDIRQQTISSAIRSWYKKKSPLSNYFLQYEYYPDGFLDWSTPEKSAPFLLMDFIEAKQLSADYLKTQTPEFIGKLAADFFNLMKELDRAGVGHGDISPGNLMVKTDMDGNPHLILVDYDDLYVPEMGGGMYSMECGKSSYQHKSRVVGTEFRLDKTIHYFSSIVFYLTLLVLQVDLDTYKIKLPENGLGDSGILFTAEDFKHPEKSVLFANLRVHRNEKVRYLANVLYTLSRSGTTEGFESLPQVLARYLPDIAVE